MPTAGSARFTEHLVLLARDESLIEALVSVLPPGALIVVPDEVALASQVLSGQAGVAFIDATAPQAAGQLAQRLHQQLPDLVLVVAGDGAAQTELAALVADGTIYRFVHKPVSPQRVKLFVDAAWRKRDGASTSGVYPTLTAPPPQLPPVAQPARTLNWPAIIGGILFVGGAASWFALHSGQHAVPDDPQSQTPKPQNILRSLVAAHTAAPAAPVATPTSSAAAAATTAADLDRLATAAEQALLAGNIDEAARLTEAARAVDPNHVRVKFLTAQVTREQARLERRRAAALAAQPSPDFSSAPAAVQSTAMPAASAPAVPVAAAPLPVTPTSTPAPVVAASVTTASGPAYSSSPAITGPPTSAPPVSEARDPLSVAAVILRRVYSVDPVFPEVAREHELTGYVDLEFMVQPDGTVADVTVLKGQPEGIFDRAAVNAVSKWRYVPIERNGVPVSEHARLRLNFNYK